MKHEALDKEDTPVSSSHFRSSTFIDFNDSSDEDVYLFVNSDINVSSSFLAPTSDVYPTEDVPSNLNYIQDQSFKTVIDCLKAMSIAPHLLNKLKSLDYNKIKIQFVSPLPITFNDKIIFEMPPICLPTGHYGQMQSMDHKYDGHAWCKVKTSNIKNNFSF